MVERQIHREDGHKGVIIILFDAFCFTIKKKGMRPRLASLFFSSFWRHKMLVKSKVIVLTFFLFLLAVLSIFSSSASADELKTKKVDFLFKIKEGGDIPLNQPTAVHIGRNRNIYILDGVNARVAVFDDGGNFLFSFGKEGNGQGEFALPVGMTIDKSGNVYVADTGNHRVQIFGPQGRFQYQFDLSGPKGIKPPDPTALVKVGNELFIVDNDNHRIQVYGKKGEFHFQWGRKGDETSEFNYPSTIAVDGEKNLYVVDVLNTRIQIFDYNGVLTGKIGEWGVMQGQFVRPKGIAIWKDSEVFISDSYMGVIEVFRKNGEYLYTLGRKKGKIQRFTTPSGLFIDDHDRLYVCEMLDNSVSVYSLK